MRQALDQHLSQELDAVERIVDVLLRNSTDEEQILSSVASVLVQTLDYEAVLILLGDQDGDLPLRAYALHPSATTVHSLQPVLQQALSRTQTLNVDEVIDRQRHTYTTVPFGLPGEFTGRLLILSTPASLELSSSHLLQIIAQHLALGLRNARLYRRMAQQQRVAQTFAQMAFSSSAYLHTMRNQIGGLRTYLGLVGMLPHMTPRQRTEVIATGGKAIDSLDQVAEILDHLHEPWTPQAQVDTDVNDCLTAAMVKLFRGLAPRQRDHHHITSRGMHLQWRLADGLPPVHTSPDMLTEAFHIVIRNAVDALHEKYGSDRPLGSRLYFETVLEHERHVIITIQDNGPGIAAADQPHIFELGWSTKEGRGMGFGLFWTRNFVQGLGGELEVSSIAGEGATFRFRLPAAPGSQT